MNCQHDSLLVARLQGQISESLTIEKRVMQNVCAETNRLRFGVAFARLESLTNLNENLQYRSSNIRRRLH